MNDGESSLARLRAMMPGQFLCKALHLFWPSPVREERACVQACGNSSGTS